VGGYPRVGGPPGVGQGREIEMRNWRGHAKKQDAVYGVQCAFEDWMKENSSDKAEIEWVMKALNIDRKTADELRAIEYIVNKARK
jgi:hypothetical protein